MFKVALTGGIGCGKSTVCKLFAQREIPVIDTDIIARELVEPGKQSLLEISDYFGSEILYDNGSLNRKILANKVFNDDKARLYLESILHPKIKNIIEKKINKLYSTYVIIAIPLLFETKKQADYDRILVIDCDEKQQLERTLSRDQRSISEIKKIIKSQVSRKERNEGADDIIDNTHHEKFLDEQVNQLHMKYTNLANTSS